jgi:hypothetical protein
MILGVGYFNQLAKRWGRPRYLSSFSHLASTAKAHGRKAFAGLL